MPIETMVRELDWKLHLAVSLANSRRQIYIGHHDVIHKMVPYLKNGVYVGKNMVGFDNDSRRLLQLQEKGFTSIFLHEEGAVFKGDENTWRYRLSTQYDPECFKQNDIICTWGKLQHDYDIQRGAKTVKITGHPKFDLYRPPGNRVFTTEAKNLSEKYGRIILINTNFGGFNNGVLSSATEEEKKNVELHATQASNLYSMIALIGHLSQHFPDRTIVMRPHPAEKNDIYVKMLSHLTNVVIERSGSLGAWLKAADCLIHNCCTTGIEGYFSGTPILSYALPNLQSYVWLASQIGDSAANPKEVVDWINNLSDYKPKIHNRDRVEDLIENFRERRETDFYKLCDDEINKKTVSRQNFRNADLLVKPFTLSLQVRKKIGILLARQSIKHSVAKFPLFNKRDIAKMVLSHNEAHQKNVSFTFHSPYLFSIRT